MGRKEKESDHQPWEGRDRGSIPPGFIFLGIFGAAAATAASCNLQTGQWRKPVDWFYTQLWRSGYYSRFGSGVPGSGQNKRAWAQYRRRVREMEEDERERVERIRRMQQVFSRERNKHKRGPEQWTEHGTSAGWHQQFQRDDWYYKAQSQNANRGTNYQSASKQNANHAKSHHYAILGLDRSFPPTPEALMSEIDASIEYSHSTPLPDMNSSTEVERVGPTTSVPTNEISIYVCSCQVAGKSKDYYYS